MILANVVTDFTDWLNHFKNEFYRNWLLPPSADFGVRGSVEIELVIERSSDFYVLGDGAIGENQQCRRRRVRPIGRRSRARICDACHRAKRPHGRTTWPAPLLAMDRRSWRRVLSLELHHRRRRIAQSRPVQLALQRSRGDPMPAARLG